MENLVLEIELKIYELMFYFFSYLRCSVENNADFNRIYMIFLLCYLFTIKIEAEFQPFLSVFYCNAESRGGGLNLISPLYLYFL